MKSPDGPIRGFDRASIFMISGAMALASMSTMTHAIGPRCDWLVIALVRASVMFVTAATLVRVSGSRLVFLRPRTLWVRSLAGSFSLVCNFYALTKLPPADVVTLTNIHPLWIVLITAVGHRRWPRLGEALGVACGLAGVVLIERPDLPGDHLAALVALLSSVSTTVAMLGLHRLRNLDSRAVVTHFAGVASLVALSWLLIRGDLRSSGLFEGRTLLLLAGIGATGTLGQIFLTKAYAAGSPSKVAVVGLTQVVFAMGLEAAIWGRSMTLGMAAGFVLILGPTTWLSLQAARSKGTHPITSDPPFDEPPDPVFEA